MAPVPERYRGLWRRSLYAEPAEGEAALVDRDTRVYWLQVGDWHADLRVPADRPDCPGVRSVDDCPRAQLVRLAGQTAFAGITRVEGRFCTWHRLIDLSPELAKDIGVMRFVDDDTLEERHPQGLYRERWERVPVSAGAEPLARVDDGGLPRWLEYGDYAMAITPRAALGAAHDLLAPASTLDDTALRERLSLRIDFAERRPDGWHVARSTHPWREGLRLPVADTNDSGITR